MPAAIGEASTNRIVESAAGAMRRAIEETGGREVFFAGTLSAEGLVESVRVLARGHEEAVPAVFEGLRAREAVIHNHPSGDIAPSEADLELSVMYSHGGHGVFIVDNDVERVYVVIEPLRDADISPLGTDELVGLFAADSPLARRIPGYENRPQQLEMMGSVANAFNDNSVAVIEAPTGVGKTLAYLAPSAMWALRNRERVVISTRTINLQEQIVYKDIPELQEAFDEPFHTVLVKGRSNYVCPRRLKQALSESTLFGDENELEELRAIADWAERTTDGSASDLSFVPSRGIWERICSEADVCTMAQCKAQGNCFVPRARREIAKADIIVVNHHMLFSDLSIKKEIGNFTALAVLPGYRRLILDEAHHVEESATEYFGREVTRNGALALFGRLQRDDRGRVRGLLPLIKAKIMQLGRTVPPPEQDRLFDLLDNSIAPALAAARADVVAAFQVLRNYVADQCEDIGRDIKWRLTAERLEDPVLRELHSVYVLPAADEVDQLAQHCGQLYTGLERIEPAPGDAEHPFSAELAQLRAYRERLRRLAQGLRQGTHAELTSNTVRWVEIDAERDHIVRVVECPLNIGKLLAEWVYANLKTTVLTSATLAVDHRLDFFYERTGLSEVGHTSVDDRLLESPFEFRDQARLCIFRDLVTPDSPEFLEESVQAMRDVLDISQGRAFILFTSFYALNGAYARLESELRAKGIVPLKQGESARTKLIDRFRSEQSCVLFGTDSFWEGIDVAGDSLQCVILPRLPFPVPTEPVLQARAQRIEEAGGNAFLSYMVPLAIIKLRQGFGRLIRRRTDFGAVVILDSRICSRHYGARFLRSLPDAERLIGSRQDVLNGLRTFFEEHKGTTVGRGH